MKLRLAGMCVGWISADLIGIGVDPNPHSNALTAGVSIAAAFVGYCLGRIAE